jgi:Tol biopolymer transport system component
VPENGPVWSRDGRQVAVFRQEQRGLLGVYVIMASGAGERRVSQVRAGLAAARLDWSGDGRFLATSDRDGEHAPRLALISVATGVRQWITEPQGGDVNDWHPVFSSDGESVAFVRQVANAVQDLYVMPIHIGADGTAVTQAARRLTFLNRQLYGHAWSADAAVLCWRPG